jgi:hypothetical protein
MSILALLQRIAIKGRFNSRTRDKVSVLAQILQENQPLSVRGAMYRGDRNSLERFRDVDRKQPG